MQTALFAVEEAELSGKIGILLNCVGLCSSALEKSLKPLLVM